MAKQASQKRMVLSLVCFTLSACAFQSDCVDGVLPASEGLAHIKLAQHANDNNERYQQLDAVLSTSNKSIATLNGKDWCDFYNGIHGLAFFEQGKSGSVLPPENDRTVEDNRSLDLGQRILKHLAEAAITAEAGGHRPVDYRALNYAERLYLKHIAIGTKANREYPSDFRDLADCFKKAGDKASAEKAINAYHAALTVKEHATHWTIQAMAVSEEATLLERENKLPAAEQKLKLLLSIYEAHDDLSLEGLRKFRKKMEDTNSRFELRTCMALKQLADFYNRTGRTDEEKPLRQRLQKLHCEIWGSPKPF